MSDRIAVIFEGNIIAEVDPKNTTEQELGLLMAGCRKIKKPNTIRKISIPVISVLLGVIVGSISSCSLPAIILLQHIQRYGTVRIHKHILR
ncbi:hypothetical protein AB9M62_12100 [Bacillales bacterium AN1005]